MVGSGPYYFRKGKMKQQQLELKSLRRTGGAASAEGVTYYRRAAESLKSYISRGNLQAGARLPGFCKMAESLEISKLTLDKALGQLEQEGLVKRQQGKGIFVADRLTTGELAVVMSPSLMGPNSSPVFKLAYFALIEEVHNLNPNWQVKMHSGRLPESAESHAASLDLMEPDVLGRLRGVFTFHDLFDLEERLTGAGVPVVTMGSASKSLGIYKVGYDHDDFLHKALEHLDDIGCRSIGLAWRGFTWPGYESEDQSDLEFAKKMELFGMQCRREWMPHCDNLITEQYGYDLFVNFWKQKLEKPEAIVVVDDVLCMGVLRAITHLGLDMPRDIKLITYGNKGVELPYHKTISRIEYDSTEQARVAAEMMMGLIQGKEPPERNTILSGKLIVGQTTVEKRS
jgi:GntR family transcriptional regulator, arabinose operon transcriptional repressor